MVIPYGRQSITESDIESVVDVLRSDFLTQGPVVPNFERMLCSNVGAKHAIVVNSCTSALHIACLSLGLGPGDILWTSPITFVASANCALYCGASVDFVDIEFNTALMSVDALEEKLIIAEKNGKLPKIVIPVHFSGQPCDMEEIYKLGEKYKFSIIEDAAHAIGAQYKDESVGNCRYSDITVFSFHPVKNITTGEGGVAMTNNHNLAKKMSLFRSHGITRNSENMDNFRSDPWYYEQISLGYNYRLTDIQAALGVSQLKRLDKYIEKRVNIASWYNENLNKNIVPLVRKKDRQSSHHLYVVMVQGGEKERNLLYEKLIKSGIMASLHYIPVYMQPFFGKTDLYLENSEKYYRCVLSLPIYPAINFSDLERISCLCNAKFC
jgi:UDP-4-amino-4,6-dideoxy-N-acetyl-beta-L-altrosamine transaminase